MGELDRLHAALGAHLELRAAFDRERARTEMMAYQRGAILAAVHRMQLGSHTVAEVAARVEEIFRAGMAAEVKAGYDEQLATVTGERDDALRTVETLTGTDESTSDTASPEVVGVAHAPVPDKPGPAETGGSGS